MVSNVKGAGPMFTSLRLERFKSFQDAELKLGPFTVLIGANASGKSNVRDAFRFLHGIGRGYSLAEIIGEKYGEGGERVWTGIRGGVPEIAYRKSRSFALTVTMRADEEDGKDLRYWIEVGIDKVRVISKVIGEHLVFNIDNEYFDVRSTKNHKLNVKVKRFPDREELIHPEVDESIRSAFFEEFKDSVNLYTIPQDCPFMAVVSSGIESFPFWSEREEDDFFMDRQNFNHHTHQFSSCRFFDWSLDAMRRPSPPGQVVLSDNGRNLSSVLQAICRDAQGKRNLLSWITELTPMDAVDFEFPTDPTGKVLATLIEKNGQRITLASASDGTLRFLAFLAAFLGPHRSSFYFFEELENGIHPTRLSLLLDLVENQVKHKGIQVVATTHSPHLLGHLSDSSLEHASLIYRLEDQPDARIIRLLDMPDAPRVIKRSGAAYLAATGWFDSIAFYMQPDPDDEEVSPRPTRRRKAGVSR
jgi:predicted ATPase